MVYCKPLSYGERVALQEEMKGPKRTRVNGTPKAPNDGYERGVSTEERFHRLCNDPAFADLRPHWLVAVEWSTVRDDQEGVDFWAITTLGRIPIQVKSSRIAKDKFEAQDERRHIVCIAILPHIPDKDMLTQAVMEIAEIWDALDRARTPQAAAG